MPSHGDARAKTREITLDQRDDIALPVDAGEIGRVTRGRTSGIGLAVRLLRIDQLRALLRVFLREQSGHRNLRKSRIGVIPRQIGIGQLHRFDSLVQLFRAERPELWLARTVPGCSTFPAPPCPARWAAIRKLSIRDRSLRSARPTPPRKFLQIVRCHRAAEFARSGKNRFRDFARYKTPAVLLRRAAEALWQHQDF